MDGWMDENPLRGLTWRRLREKTDI